MIAFNDRCRPSPKFLLGLLGVLILSGNSLIATAQTRTDDPEIRQPKIMKGYYRLPLSFEVNRGQADPRVKFLATGAGYSLLLTGTNAVLSISSRRPAPRESPEKTLLDGQVERRPRLTEDSRPKERRVESDVLELELTGSRPGIKVAGEDELPGTANYFIGKEPARWFTGIPTYSRVRYVGAYPGVDLVYYGNRQELEYDFVVAPHANASQIRLRLRGATKLAIDLAGDLIIHTETGQISFRKPLLYQLIGGRRVKREGAFELAGIDSVRFQVATYDHTKPLVIDPILSYSTFIEGSTTESGAVSIAVDAAGEAFVTGWAFPPFPITPGAYQTTSDVLQGSTVFISKLSADGRSLLYSTYLEANGFSWSNAIAIDGQGDAYVAGDAGENFPTTPGAFQTTDPTGVNLAFVSKLNSTGTALLYSTYIGGSVSTNPSNAGLPQNTVYAMAVDGAGEAFLTGYTYARDFPTTSGAFQPKLTTGNVNGTGWVAKMNSAGSALVYGTYLGGGASDAGRGIAIDSAGNAIVAGYTESTDFPVTSNALQSTDNAAPIGSGTTNDTGFVSKLNSTGSSLIFSTFLGGSNSDQMLAAATDAAGSAYIVGTCLSKDFPATKGAFQTTMQESWNPCMAKISSDGSSLNYATYVGGSGEDTGVAIAVDSSGDAYITGDASAVDFPVTPGAFQTENYASVYSGDLGSFLTEMNPSGSALVYSTFVGGSGSLTGENCGCATALALDSSANVYVVGRTFSEDFRTTPGAYMTTLEADEGAPPWLFESSSVFVIKFNAGEMKPIPLSTTTVTANPNPQIPFNAVTFTAHVAPSSAGVIPTGLIGFDYQGYVWATATLDSTGSASYTPPDDVQTLGQDSMVVLYLGDSNNAPSSTTMTENIALYPTTTMLSITPNSVVYGTVVTFDATVTSTPPTPVPIGTVEFFNNQTGNPMFSAPLDATGHAAVTSSTLLVGTTQFFAFYQATDNVHVSTNSPLVAETILAPPAPPSPAFSPAPGSYSSAQSVSLTDSAAGAAICYTTDGTQPAALCQPLGSTTVYTRPIPVSQTTTINALAVAGDATASPIVTGVYILGNKPPGFTISGTAVAVAPGTTTSNTSTITVTPSGGFIGSVALDAAITSSPVGSQDKPTVTFNAANALNLTGPNAALATLTVITTAPTTSTLVYPKRPNTPWYAVGGAAIACVFLFLTGARRNTLWTILGMVVLLVALAFGAVACGNGGNSGGGGNPGTTAGTYTITVTGTSGTTTETGMVTLTVQ